MVSTAAFLDFMRISELTNDLLRFERDCDLGDPENLRQTAKSCRDLITSTAFSASLLADIEAAYANLATVTVSAAPKVAVRSSATGEDGATSSFAGQYDSYLGLRGVQGVANGVRRCWASLFTERAMQYRHENGLSFIQCPMAVGVIHLIEAKAAGVAFSIDPVTGKSDRMIIEANWGFGEAVVQGVTSPDRAVLDRDSLKQLDYAIGTKKIISMLDETQGVVVERQMPETLQTEKVLKSENVIELGGLLDQIETAVGAPVDLEWVLDARTSEIYLVQLRPISTDADHMPPYWSTTRIVKDWRAYAKELATLEVKLE